VFSYSGGGVKAPIRFFVPLGFRQTRSEQARAAGQPGRPQLRSGECCSFPELLRLTSGDRTGGGARPKLGTLNGPRRSPEPQVTASRYRLTLLEQGIEG
jgi:hypothetical protein